MCDLSTHSEVAMRAGGIVAKKKPNPISMRLSQEALDAIEECAELAGMKRSAVVAFTVLKFRDELRARRAAAGQPPWKKKKN